MRAVRPILLVAFAAVMLGATQIAGIAGVGPVAAVRAGSEAPVTQAQNAQESPAVFGDVVVWQDDRDSASTEQDIWMKDLATGVESPVTQAQHEQSEAAIFGDIVVWQDDRDSASTGLDIWMKDLATGIESPVTQAQHEQSEAAIFGDIVVWTDERDAATTGSDIWMKDLTTGVESPVTQADGDQERPAVYGDIVVWQDARSAATGWDVWMMDLAAGVEAPVARSTKWEWEPAVYGERVAWALEFAAHDWDVMTKDLVTGVETPATRAPVGKMVPVVFGDLVVWTDGRKGNATPTDLWMADLANGTETPLTLADEDQGHPAIHGHLVTWEDHRDWASTGYDIYAARIDGPPTQYIDLEGQTRYETAAMASMHAYRSKVPVDREGFRTVVVATGRNWPDALGASALAGVLDAPVLITQPDYVPAAVKDEIVRLDADRVIFAGGEDVVTPAVQTELAAAGIGTFERLAGPTRYETADAVARRTAALQGAHYDGTAFVATGLLFPDALAAAPVAAAEGWPVFLAGAQGISAGTWDAMDDIGVREVHILGGPGAVSTDVEEALNSRFGTANVTRHAGPTRYETAVAVARFGTEEAGLQWDTLAVATGENFPDALTGGTLQARTYSVLLLTRGESLPPEVASVLTEKRDHVARLRWLGGTDVVSPGVRSAVAGLLH
jgi:beta propeller repeat protein